MAKHFITQNNSQGQAVFDQSIPEDHNSIDVPFGKITNIHAIPELPANVNESKDIDLTKECRTNGLPQGRVTIDNGLAGAIVQFKPGATSPLHRTRSLDIGVVLEGEIELELDSGEKRILKAGDTLTQRGTSHKWTNVTPNDGWVKIFFVGIDAAPIQVGGKELPEAWGL